MITIHKKFHSPLKRSPLLKGDRLELNESYIYFAESISRIFNRSHDKIKLNMNLTRELRTYLR